MQRFIGVVLGAVVTYLLLLGLVGTAGDATRNYLIAVIAGAIVAIVWPWIVGFYIGRQVKQRREEETRREAEKVVAEERRSD
jgi:cytochrome c biogenesis protein CcdA